MIFTLNSISTAKKSLLIEKARKKLKNIDEWLEDCLKEQPEVSKMIASETKSVNSLKSTIKTNADRQLVMDQEFVKLDKQVKENNIKIKI